MNQHLPQGNIEFNDNEILNREKRGAKSTNLKKKLKQRFNKKYNFKNEQVLNQAMEWGISDEDIVNTISYGTKYTSPEDKYIIYHLPTTGILVKEDYDANKKEYTIKTIESNVVHANPLWTKITVSKQDQWENQLTSLEKQAINYYTGMGYKYINTELRKSTVDGEESKYIKLIDSALKKAAVSNKMTVYRYTDERQVKGRQDSLQQFKDLQLDTLENINDTQKYIQMAQKIVENWVGKTIKEPAYTSTAIEKTAKFSGRPIRFEIEVPKGTHAAYISSMSNFPDEKELLLPRGSKFKVMGASTVTENNAPLLIIKVTLV
ncbi:ADP-ribosyltransferase [Bacillus sp. CDB3]|uniref:ADP-ribosyltransferase n=1 Tax=Bacillus sp. CDB3 TaxID=360310 RepID=UPI0015C4A695|nr:ADP-ribosyltransferase [Bacillus sp. CDB3]